MKLTRQMFIDGIDDVDGLKIAELKEFCDTEGFDINCAARRGKPAILNDIVACIEISETPCKNAFEVSQMIEDSGIEMTATEVSENIEAKFNELETVTESTKSEPLPEMDKLRPNGEVIRLAKDGKDYGANLINRTK